MTAGYANDVLGALVVGEAFIQVTRCDPGVAARVLDTLGSDLDELDPDMEAKIWPVKQLPAGPGILFDLSVLEDEELAENLLRRLTGKLDAAGQTDAVVVIPPDANSSERGWIDEGAVVPAVIAHVYGAPSPYNFNSSGPSLPLDWIERCLRWRVKFDQVSIRGEGLPDTWIDRRDAPSLVDRLLLDTSDLTISSPGSMAGLYIRTKFVAGHSDARYVMTGYGGRGWKEQQFARLAEVLAAQLVTFDPLPTYAAVVFEPAPEQFIPDEPIDISGERAIKLHGVCDIRVPDFYVWQLLSSGHRDRLGGWPSIATVLDEDHAVVTAGSAGEVEELRRVLAPLLVANADAFALRAARPDPPPSS